MQKGPIIVRHPGVDAPVVSFKNLLALKISALLQKQGLSSRDAEEITGIDASEFCRLRNGRLERFTIDRLVMILGTLGVSVELRVLTKAGNLEPFAIEAVSTSQKD